ncbi:MAG TPA: phosphoenolpyruvate synthase, partial [Puia sp.]|nr:phosphoenolpyruvate synthase [Puia sp.]
MTDPMRPLGLSLWQLIAFRPMFKAGGRLFVDVAQNLASPAGRAALLVAMGQHDPLIKDALETIIGRGNFSTSDLPPAPPSPPPIEADPAIVQDLIQASQTALEALRQNIQSRSGSDLLDFILDDIQQLKKRMLHPKNMSAIMAGINASSWINGKMKEWLGENNVADALSQSAPNNVTSEMGLGLLHVTDVIRPYPEVIDYLQHTKDDDLLAGLLRLEGGKEVRAAFDAYLQKYGMRCAGEIDITRTRWSERPGILVPLILSNLKNQELNAGHRKFEQGRQEAAQKEQDLLDRLSLLPDGAEKAKETKRMVAILRDFIGYREYPKYSIVCHLFAYKQALLKEAERLVQAGVISAKEDIYYFTFEELRTSNLDPRLIGKRKAEYERYESLTPPRVITSDGEIIQGKYKHENLPARALAGLAVSSGIAEGRARVIFNLEDAEITEGDILVTTFTDPSWTPSFVSIKGLVTEVGGLMTHGAVIAREYGLPAVVGVEHATRLIKDGQWIRVNGTAGYIEILEKIT